MFSLDRAQEALNATMLRERKGKVVVVPDA